VLLLAGTSRQTGSGAAHAKALAIPLFRDNDLDGLIQVLSEPTGRSDR
jgi:hypothetical protein